jgi:hypothetical protein
MELSMDMDRKIEDGCISWKKLLFVLASTIILSGCVTSLTANLASGVSITDLGKIYVVHFEPDKRNFHTEIADQLSLMGYQATYGEESSIPEDAETIVTYIDNWQWDIINYMIRIRIQLRDKDSSLIANGESYRTSLARKRPEEMIRETLEEILNQ